MSSRRRLRYQMCSRKKRYATVEDARRMLVYMQSIWPHYADAEAYACAYCGAAHVGHRGRRLRGTSGHHDRSRGLQKWW